ncbi:MAG: gluconate 2-dehydrogenase subunit 3 family protein [Sulfurovum sp.]|nr:gluconate 2-dehydrogenase subunit 3 family protein [Sulfurovum sp.]
MQRIVGQRASASFEKQFRQREAILEAVQEHLFPQGNDLPSAKTMKMTAFLFDTMKHASFDKDIKAFVLEGAKELDSREKGKFLAMTQSQKEASLRDYETTRYGSAWLSRIMTLSMEALFCDPIYGSNVAEAGWKFVGSDGGFPRPQTKYLGV